MGHMAIFKCSCGYEETLIECPDEIDYSLEDKNHRLRSTSKEIYKKFSSQMWK